jgi:hypothetical protein
VYGNNYGKVYCISEAEMIQRTASNDSDTGEGRIAAHYSGQSTGIAGAYFYVIFFISF